LARHLDKILKPLESAEFQNFTRVRQILKFYPRGAKNFKIYLATGPPLRLCAPLFSAKTPAAALIIGNFIRKLAGSLGTAKLKRF